ncbi:MAG: class I SAM-dependent methyltransferase, partial [Clostridiales bacterium]|nr:class I SAM-dependent methyltransferase [Clostridiales bacterium]
MDSYTSFAKVYDLFMDNIPYEKWCKYVLEILNKYGI